MTDAEKKKGLFDDSDEEGGDDYKPQAEAPVEDQTAASEPVYEPPKEEAKPALFDDDDDGEYKPQAEAPAESD